MMHYLTKDAIPVFAELIPDCDFTEWDTPSEIGIKLVCAYVLKHETGSLPYGWATAAEHALNDAGLRSPKRPTLVGIAHEIKTRKNVRTKRARVPAETLERVARIMNGEDE